MQYKNNNITEKTPTELWNIIQAYRESNANFKVYVNPYIHDRVFQPYTYLTQDGDIVFKTQPDQESQLLIVDGELGRNGLVVKFEAEGK